MLRDHFFLSRNPSHFHINPIVKAFFVSEAFICSGWNFIVPIIAIFVVTTIKGGNVEIAGIGYSINLISRVIAELITGRILLGAKDTKKMIVAIIGISCLSLAYFSFMFASTITLLYLSYAIVGIGFGVASPAKNSLFSMHLDKNKEATEWSLNDALSAICMSLSAALGGFVVHSYGFTVLFFLAMMVNIIAIVPYLLYIKVSLSLSRQ